MSAENAHFGIQLREQNIEQRLLSLAEERTRSARDKASKEAAVEERRKIVEQQKAERQREQFNKTRERLSMAEIQRIEILDSYRKRKNLREQKCEDRKANEMSESQILQKKIQEKVGRF
jgi:hypothetical protein